jgi:hypothetical protein
VSLDRRLDVAVLHRSFAKNYHSFHASAFAESREARNEKGVYLGFSLVPFRSWNLNAYFDFWRKPWATFTADSPSIGREWFARLTYTQKRRMEIYVQLKNEVKEENSIVENIPSAGLAPRQNLLGRIHLSFQLSKSLELRSRVDAGFSKFEGRREKGAALLQDLIYKPAGSAFSFSTRFAIFQTDGYAIRFYNYENDLLKDFSIPAYYDSGTRFYFNTRYRINRMWQAEARFARSFYTNREVIGSSLEELSGPVKSDFKVQLRATF